MKTQVMAGPETIVVVHMSADEARELADSAFRASTVLDEKGRRDDGGHVSTLDRFAFLLRQALRGG